MASRTERTRNLIGGMQLGPPGDKTAEGNSLLIQNFRVDQNNVLRSRYGSVKRAGPIGSGDFHTLKRTGEQEYAGIGEGLYHGSTLSNNIASGFDGKPLGAAFYRGGGWWMNRAKRVRTNGAEVRNWGVEAPASAPVAVGGDAISTEIEEWEGGDINVGIASETDASGEFTAYAMQSGAPVENDQVTASFDGNGKSGGSLKMVANGPVSFSAFAKISKSTAVDGQTQDEDQIRIWVFASDPKAVTGLTVFVKSGDEGYAEYAFLDPQKWLNQSLNAWTQLKVRRHINLDDWSQRVSQAVVDGNQQNITDLESQFATAIQTPTFIYTGSGWPQTGVGSPQPSTFPPTDSMLAIDWNGITEIGVSFKVNAACQVGVDRAEATGNVGPNSSGAISYYVSFVTVNLEDSNPSPASNSVIGAGNRPITLNSVPVSPDPSVSQRWIYRIGGGLSQPYRVGILFDNATSTWEDKTSNRIAQRDNIVMPINRDLPPPARGVVGPIFGKIIAFSTAAHPARIFWTPSNHPWYFPGADDEAIGNWQDAGGDDDDLIAATDHKPITVLYKRRSIWRLRGDPETSDPEKTNANVGIVGPNAVVDAGGVDYFVGPEGVYRFNLDFEEKISGAIDPIFKGDYVRLGSGDQLPPISPDFMYKTAIEIVGDRLRVSYTENGFSSPNVIAIMHLDTGRWAMERYSNLAAPAFTVMLNQGAGVESGGRFFAGATAGGGYFYWIETIGFHLDDGQSARGIWQSPFLDQGLPNNFKIYSDLEIDCRTIDGQGVNSPLSVYLVYDNGTKVLIGTVTSADAAKPRQTFIFRLMSEDGQDVGRKAKNASVRIEGDLLGIVEIYGVYLHWYPEERVARSFDSGPTHLGLPERAKQIDHVELYVTASGQRLQRVLASDLPGNLLTHRIDDQFTAPNGRGTVRQRLTSIVEGRNFRFWTSDSPSGSTFQVHQARVRMRPVGEYIDGTIGEFYESPEFSVEPGRVGELKDLLLDYDASGDGGRLDVYTDLPGTALAVRMSLPIPARITRAPHVFPFESPTLTAPFNGITSLPFGQLFKVRLYPPPGGILRLHGRAQFRARLIGTYFNGENGEIWETQPLDLLDGMGIFREISVTAQTAGPMWFEMLTELPGQQLSTVARFPVDTSSVSGRAPVYSRLPGNTKGMLQQFRLIGPHITRLFDVSILARKTELSDSQWTWIPVPFERTPDGWAGIPMPVRETPAAFAWVDLPVDSIE